MMRSVLLISVVLSGVICLVHALRLSVLLLYGVPAVTVFPPWYLTHTALAGGIGDRGVSGKRCKCTFALCLRHPERTEYGAISCQKIFYPIEQNLA